MGIKGGLKLRLEPAAAADRQIRLAQMTLAPASGGESTALVTDANGCMDYRLDNGDYTLSVSGGPSSEVQVRYNRWTVVRLRLL